MGKVNKVELKKAQKEAIRESDLTFLDAASLLEKCLIDCGIELFSDKLMVKSTLEIQTQFQKGFYIFLLFLFVFFK